MQKVFRRTILAERQVARRAARRTDANTRSRERNEREQNTQHRKEEVKLKWEAKLARREDYELGPLAPRRDVGSKKDTYGAIHSELRQGRILLGAEKWKILNFWGGKFLNLVEGDRVVILEGIDKGKIGKVTSIDTERAECVVEGLNMADLILPKYVAKSEGRATRSLPIPISLKSIRLVVPMFDSKTGVTRDVIVKELSRSKPYFDRSGKASWTRFITGLNHEVPFPSDESPAPEDYASDTLRDAVEERTFVPSLLTPPMPMSVIDELRNRYSVFRTRHEPEYIKRKQQEEDEKLEKKKASKKMRTPLKEANRKARKEKRKLARAQNSKEVLEKIGMAIASKKNLLVDAAGVSTEVAEPLTP